MSAGDAHTWNRLERELDYYKREVNAYGAETVRAREEQSRAVGEARRARVLLKLVREVYRLGDFGGAEADPEQAVLGLIVENAMCDQAMLLFGPHEAEGRFRVVCALGGEGARRIGAEIVLRRPPRFCFTTGEGRREGQAAEMCALIGVPYVLWSYDPGGFAILLGNRQESNASKPFEATDRELVETALSVYLDIRHRKTEARRLERALAAVGQDVAEAPPEPDAAVPPEDAGTEEAEIQAALRNGGRLTGFVVVDRTRGGGPEFVGYVRGSWTPGYRLLRTFRGRSDRTYKDLGRLIHLARFDFGYTPPIAVYAAGAPELRRFAGIWPADLAPYSGAGDASGLSLSTT